MSLFRLRARRAAATSWRSAFAAAASSFAFASYAQVLPPCVTSVPTLPVLDPALGSARLSDLTLTCSGVGNAADPPLITNFSLFLSAPLVGMNAPTLSDGTTIYTGVVSSNQAIFQNIAVDLFDGTLVFGELFVDPSAALEGAVFTGLLSSFGVTFLPIANPLVTLAVNGTIDDVPPAKVPLPGTAWLVLAALAAWRWLGRSAPAAPGRPRLRRMPGQQLHA